MFVITADQHDSRASADLVPAALDVIVRYGGSALPLPPERTAGDEVQALVATADAALDIILALTRTHRWSVGLGAGTVDDPLPNDVRAGRGSAFIHARDAVDRAKKAATRVAVSADDAEDAEALLRLLIELRDRRTDEGWEVYELLAGGITQRAAAEQIGISESAVSRRVAAASIRVEEAARPALARVLARLGEP
ncbi:transcriptional regulator [Microbacterium faecale]|uniref:Transcriptional regulator n=1 Tax=Microbacterium faecale TaxID=1804630 RepID=A0A916YGX5_9MICO|nr:DNA-binding protein [Microbacterium faecale]GGD44400.1 transcriptional regulator [Microbacterium faecale]